MELFFSGGKFVSNPQGLNYEEVLDDFNTAKLIRIMTYNISKNQRDDNLLDRLKQSDADIQIITNVPSRMETYYNSLAGNNMRSKARENIQIYLSKLSPDKYSKKFTPLFNVHNHAKLIGTENVVYIGSANYSNESADNIETGVIIDDKKFISELYRDFFDEIREKSLSYYEEGFSAFRLFALSLLAKFDQHHKKFIANLYTNYGQTKYEVSDIIFVDSSDLESLSYDLDELRHIWPAAEDTYDEENNEYNEALEELKERFDRLSIDWLQAVIGEDGSLYNLVCFNQEDEVNKILQEEFSAEAYEDNLEECIERSENIALDILSSLKDEFSYDADSFLLEIEKILSTLSYAVHFTENWKASKINPEIDNT